MYYVKKTLLRYGRCATKLRSVAAHHISPQDLEATIITTFITILCYKWP